MRNHDIGYVFLSLFFMLFSFLCMKLRNGTILHTIKTVSSIILGISILCNGGNWCKTSFIRRENKMTPVVSRLIWCTIIETKNYRIEVQGNFAF